MFSNQAAYVTVNGPCRAIGAIHGDPITSRFIVGTCVVNGSTNSNSNNNNNNNNNNNSNPILNSPILDSAAAVNNIFGGGSTTAAGTTTTTTASNRLYVIKFQTESNELIVESEFDHFIGSVNKVCTHPTDPSLVISTTEQSAGATLWKLPLSSSDNNLDDSDDPDNDTSYYDDDNDNNYGTPNRSYNNNYGSHSRSGNNSSSNNNVVQEMERMATLVHPDDEIDTTTNNLVPPITSSIAWRPAADDSTTTSSTNGDVVMIDTYGTITQWDVSFGTADPTQRTSIFVKKNSNSTVSNPLNNNTAAPKIVWDPHASSGDIVAATYGTSVHILDWRLDTTVPSGTIDLIHHSHRYGVTDIQYNPNKPYVIVTSGKDGLIKFWDIRSTKHQPLLTARGGHSHYITNVQYNPFHDQLVLSTGTDAIVNLWRFSTISSAPLLAYDDENHNSTNQNHNHHPNIMNNDNHNNSSITEGGGSTGVDQQQQQSSSSSSPNACVTRFEHGTGMDAAVYGAVWGSTDPWIYLTGTYDGKLVLHHVPSHEKYKILL